MNRGGGEPAAAVQAIAEGLVLATFSGDAYKSGERSGPPLEQALVVAGQQDGALQAAVDRGVVLGDSCNLARDLCNEPANVLTPSVFAERGAAIGKSAGLQVEILDEEEIARLGMGLLLGVARGSAEPPRLLVLRYTASHAPASPVLGPGREGHHLRHRRHLDQAGRGHGPDEGRHGGRGRGDRRDAGDRACSSAPINVIGIVPMTENMPGGRALKPGDIITGAGGKSVEVLNTDAEGRLILGDGLWYAQKLGATHLVDVATLTGACVVALGRAASGLFGSRRASPTSCAAPRIGPAIAAGRCRSSTTTASRSRARSPTWSTSAGAPPGPAPPRCSSGSSSATCPGRTSTSPARRGPTRRSPGSRRGRPASRSDAGRARVHQHCEWG